MAHDQRRRIPRTDVLLAELSAFVPTHGAPAVKYAIQQAAEQARCGEISPDEVAAVAGAQLRARAEDATSLQPLLNATGVVLHTNIGRAPLSAAAKEALLSAAGYCDVEYDLEQGTRARRGRATLAALRAAVPSASGALAVNNGAAALVLATSALAVARQRPEIIVSRGEMVEIGDGFRLHELIGSTGARVIEVGTTNRTHPRDYEEALSPQTGLVLKVHPSNFRVEGFTAGVEIADLAALLRRAEQEGRVPAPVPLLADIGSGLLGPDALLPQEPDATTTLEAGADIVTASGDKLLGGPQAGIVLGRADLVDVMARHPLARAVRVDKLTLAALEATLRGPLTPTHRALHHDLDELRARTAAVAEALDAQMVPTCAAIGGGGAPGVDLPSVAVALPAALAPRLRTGTPGVISRVEGGRCLLDLRCIPASADAQLIAAVQAARTEA
ncbi:L-seryl-tRNA(Sec) selenium transferase [Gephyromycinifex aptenodytis]|uniref:L-seryl-tRNA(Sec) selenium transferase n=1 Tax=Gephyromycinifex aptenodytis TaxID=2716227 RepID=UPI0014469363|nr:L-seryl-tRNA(Sec) selenium transferase [Gephyromycinifex aptenodytis]